MPATLSLFFLHSLSTILPALPLLPPQGSPTHRVILKTQNFKDPKLVPLFAEHRLENEVSPKFFGVRIPVQVQGKSLLVDTYGQGKFDKKIKKDRVLLLGERSDRHPVLFYKKQGHWYFCSAQSFVGKIGKTTIQFLDTNMDGFLSPGIDLVRIGKGAFGLHQDHRLLWTGNAVISYQRDDEADTPSILWQYHEEVEFGNPGIKKSFALLNGHRNSVGLPAVLPDPWASEACAKHVAYLVRNSKVTRKTRVTAKELDSAHEEDPTKPGYSKEGARAGMNSSIGQEGSTVKDLNPGFWATALHRQTMVSRSSTKAGMAFGGPFSLIWVRDWRPKSPGAPVFVPAPGQRNVHREFVAEIPEPQAFPGFNSKKRGFPISVTFLREWTSPHLALFEIGKKKEVKVEGKFFSPNQPLHPARPSNMDAILLIPSAPLRGKTWYRVTLSGTFKGKPREFHWVFRTRK